MNIQGWGSRKVSVWVKRYFQKVVFIDSVYNIFKQQFLKHITEFAINSVQRAYMYITPPQQIVCTHKYIFTGVLVIFFIPRYNAPDMQIMFLYTCSTKFRWCEMSILHHTHTYVKQFDRFNTTENWRGCTSAGFSLAQYFNPVYKQVKMFYKLHRIECRHVYWPCWEST